MVSEAHSLVSGSLVSEARSLVSGSLVSEARSLVSQASVVSRVDTKFFQAQKASQSCILRTSFLVCHPTEL